MNAVPDKVWTADELEQMTPAERHALFEASVVTDLGQAPEGLLSRARRRIAERAAGNESPPR